MKEVAGAPRLVYRAQRLTVEGLLRMTSNQDSDPPPRPARKHPAPDKSIVTPENEPSALERGARIFERLARRPGRDPQ